MRSNRLVALVLGAVLLGVPAWAQDDDEGVEQDTYKAPQWKGWGVRIGLADDPDQIVVGAQFDFGDVARRVYLEPNVELGVGDDHAILTITGALHYRFNRQRTLRPYAGSGITLGLVHFDPPNGGSDTEFEIALKLIGGVTWTLKSKREFFLEAALIAGDLQDIQVMAGWRF